MKIATMTIEFEYNAQLHGDDEEKLRQIIMKDLYLPGMIKARMDLLGHEHLANDLTIHVEKSPE